jgi:hypothetical protein
MRIEMFAIDNGVPRCENTVNSSRAHEAKGAFDEKTKKRKPSHSQYCFRAEKEELVPHAVVHLVVREVVKGTDPFHIVLGPDRCCGTPYLHTLENHSKRARTVSIDVEERHRACSGR